MKKRLGIFCMSLLALAVMGPLSAPLPATAGDKEVVILSSPSKGWPPFIIQEKDSSGLDGILVEVFREISEAEGYKFHLVFYPEKRGHLLLHEGKVDAVPKAREWVADPAAYLWTDPVVDSADVLVSRQTNPIQFSSPKDLAGLNVGLIFGFRYPRLDPLINQKVITAYRANNSQNLLCMLNHGHIDCAVVNPLVARWHIRTQADLSMDDFAFNDTQLDNAPCRFAFTADAKWKPFIAEFNRRLAAMKKDGRLDAIIARYQ